MKTFFKIIRKVIISCLCLYLYNCFSIKYNMIIPINIITVSFVSIFDIFGLLGLVIFKCLFM